MSQPLAHLYDLALRTLDEQERRADALRGRLGPVLAAAALGASLLSGPVVGGARPATTAGTLALLVACGGLVVTVAATAALLRARDIASSEEDVRDLISMLDRSGALHDASAFYLTMIARLGRQCRDNVTMIDRLFTTFTAAVCGILVMLCGLALAALVG